mgnify:CR=1 FL=1|tara:strand:+ start:2907 stop:3269 length:363 start_codon:yes stop_codon:yes gene_type:complete
MKFVKLGFNSKVISIISVNNSDCQDADGNISEVVGKQFLEHLTNYPNWVMIKDTHNGYSIGSTYFEDEDVFKPKKPFASWTYNSSSNEWEAPVTRPDGAEKWDEDNQTWLSWNTETEVWS